MRKVVWCSHQYIFITIFQIRQGWEAIKKFNSLLYLANDSINENVFQNIVLLQEMNTKFYQHSPVIQLWLSEIEYKFTTSYFGIYSWYSPVKCRVCKWIHVELKKFLENSKTCVIYLKKNYKILQSFTHLNFCYVVNFRNFTNN